MLNLLSASISALATFTVSSASIADSRIAIVDVAFDTRKHLSDFKRKGVKVIGRYYSRCKQPELGLNAKRLIDQGGRANRNSEVSQLLRGGFAVLSIYQYYYNSAQKFDGRTKKGRILRDANCEWTDVPRSVEEEAELDATAAVKQAKAMRQPRDTAIYFGADFNFTAKDQDTREKMVRYFRVIKKIVNAGGYQVGAYGSGLAHQILRKAKDAQGKTGLIKFSWISASRAFANTSDFHRSKSWHLFQNQVDKEWFGKPINETDCSRGLPLDTNVQNKRTERNIGFWRSNGAFALSSRRIRRVYNTRRFGCDGNAIVRKARRSRMDEVMEKEVCMRGKRTTLAPKIDYANAARVGRKSRQRQLVDVDIDDDGTMDGWTWAGNLTSSFDTKPNWIFAAKDRSEKTCK